MSKSCKFLARKQTFYVQETCKKTLPKNDLALQWYRLGHVISEIQISPIKNSKFLTKLIVTEIPTKLTGNVELKHALIKIL